MRKLRFKEVRLICTNSLELVSGRDGSADDISTVNVFNQSITTDKVLHRKIISQDFPGGTVTKIPHSQYGGPRFNLWSGT